MTDRAFDMMIELNNERGIPVRLLAESAAKLSGHRCTPEMINNYEKNGLIQHFSRTQGGVRLFAVRDIRTVTCIKLWQAEGFTLAQIKEKLSECHNEPIFSQTIMDLPDDRRTQILKAAAYIFPQKGYETTTMQDIAEEANISTSLIYQFFRSKEELFLAFAQNTSFHAILSRITASLEKKKVTSIEEVRQALLEVAVNYTRDHVSKVELFRLLISTSRSYPELGRNYLNNFIQPAQQLLQQYFEHLVQQDLFRPINANLAAVMFFGIWAEISLSRNFYSVNEPAIIPDESDIAELVDLFLKGAQKEPDL